MKRNGLSWDGGKKRLVAALMLLAVLVAPGAAQASTRPEANAPEVGNTEVELIDPLVRTRSPFGVSWS